MRNFNGNTATNQYCLVLDRYSGCKLRDALFRKQTYQWLKTSSIQVPHSKLFNIVSSDHSSESSKLGMSDMNGHDSKMDAKKCLI